MYTIILIILGSLWFARTISGYDSKYNDRKYFVLRNKKIAKILLPKSVGTQRGAGRRSKTDFNKMTYIGAVFYLCNLLLILSIPILLLLVPEIQTQPYEIETGYVHIFVDTVNEKLPVLLSWILLAVEIIFEFIYIIFQAKKQNRKGMIVLSYTIIAIMILLLILNIKELLFMFINWR